MTREVGWYIEEYDLCQWIKNRTEKVAEKLNSVDFITKLPIVAEKDAILVVCDRLSKMTHFIATTEETTAKGLTRLFRDNV